MIEVEGILGQQQAGAMTTHFMSRASNFFADCSACCLSPGKFELVGGNSTQLFLECLGSSARKDGCAVPILRCAAVAANRVIYDIQLAEDIVTGTPRRIIKAAPSLHADEP